MCPRCGAENFENATQCAECRLPFLASDRSDPTSSSERLRRARELLAEERFDQAIVQLLPASATDPGNVEVHRLLARAYRTKGADQYALRACEAAVRADPQDALAHCELGECYSDAGRKEEAVAQFNLALEIEPNLQQAREAYQRLEAVRDQALEEAKQQAPVKRTATAPDLPPMWIPQRSHLLEARNGLALLGGVLAAFAGAFLVGLLFRYSTSPELLDPVPAFQAFFPRWVMVLALVLGVYGAVAYHPRVPFVGVIAGALGGWAAITVSASMAGIAVAPQWFSVWVPASVGIATAMEVLAKTTHLSDRKKFLVVASSLSLIGFVAYNVLNQGRIYGYVRHTVSQEDVVYDQPLAGVEVLLQATDNPEEIYRTTTRAVGATDDRPDEWMGSYAFNRLPLKQYELLIQNPLDGEWIRHTVTSEYAITRGTYYDVYLSRNRQASNGRPKTGAGRG